jgi:hypothetical protein
MGFSRKMEDDWRCAAAKFQNQFTEPFRPLKLSAISRAMNVM